ncbi:MAG: NAD kinase [Burkholderiales bacterium]|nr:NAD kinase [Burkholderiales bacterium]
MSQPAPAFASIALIGRHDGVKNADALRALGEFLLSRGCEVMLEKGTAQTSGLHLFPVADYAGIGARARLAVVLGGDGSMLSAARNLASFGVPVVGVNQGRLGFMTDVAAGRMLEEMGQILDGRFSIEARTLLGPQVFRAGDCAISAVALNDVVVYKGSVGRLIECVVRIDGEFVYDLRSDGLIVATPTGSTAYALSSNGPILQPAVPGFLLVPICPHTLSNRPIAVSDDCAIEISISNACDAVLSFDGQPEWELRVDDRVVVRRSPHPIRFVHPPGYSYFAMLREKLHWSEMH